MHVSKTKKITVKFSAMPKSMLLLTYLISILRYFVKIYQYRIKVEKNDIEAALWQWTLVAQQHNAFQFETLLNMWGSG